MAIFTGGYGWFREFGGCRTRAVTGSSGANGLIIHKEKTKKNSCLKGVFISEKDTAKL